MAARCCRADAGRSAWCLQLEARFPGGAVPGTVRGRERGHVKKQSVGLDDPGGRRGRLEERRLGYGGTGPGERYRGNGVGVLGIAWLAPGKRWMQGQACLVAASGKRGLEEQGLEERGLGVRRRDAGNGAGGTASGGAAPGCGERGLEERGRGNGAGVRGTGPGRTGPGRTVSGERRRGAGYGKGKPEQRQGIPVRMPGNSRETEQRGNRGCRRWGLQKGMQGKCCRKAS